MSTGCCQGEIVFCNVGDPDPQDPHVFGPPGSGSISQRYGSRSVSVSFPFLMKVLSKETIIKVLGFLAHFRRRLALKAEDNVPVDK